MCDNYVFFDRVDTKAIKGIAIALMLFHHLCFFNDRLPIHFAFKDSKIIFLSSFANFCVALFLFMAGYGVWHKMIQGGNILDNIRNLLISFWKVFIIYIPIGFFFFGNQNKYATVEYISSVFSDFNINQLITNFIAWDNSYNYEWWFMRMYIISIVLGAIYLRYTKSINDIYIEIGIMLCLQLTCFILFSDKFNESNPELLSNSIIYKMLYDMKWSKVFPGVFMLGILCAKYNLILKLLDYNKNVCKNKVEEFLLAIIILTFIICFRLNIGRKVDGLITPLFIVAAKEIYDFIPGLKKGLTYVGKYSTSMWLIHSFYIYYFGLFRNIVYLTHYAIIDYVILFTMTLASSIMIDYFWNKVFKLRQHIK